MKWISVKSGKYPPKHETVLVSDGKYVDSAYLSPLVNFDLLIWRQAGFPLCRDVTHWAELPKPPEGE